MGKHMVSLRDQGQKNQAPAVRGKKYAGKATLQRDLNVGLRWPSFRRISPTSRTPQQVTSASGTSLPLCGTSTPHL